MPNSIQEPYPEETPGNKFDNFLTGLNTLEENKKRTTRKQLQMNYDIWTYHFNLLKKQFGEAWELFGTIQQKVRGWYRDTRHFDDTYIGITGYGYRFEARLCYKDPSGCRKKSIQISFAVGDGVSGINDERAIGREPETLRGELTYELIGLENCHDTLDRQLNGSECMLRSLQKHKLEIQIFNDDGSKNGKIGEIKADISFLYHYNLGELCQKLFVAINRGEVIELSKYLPAPQ